MLKKFLVKALLPTLFKKNDGFRVLDESWDNLIILDACRYDVFEEVAKERGTSGSLERRISRGTNTTTFLTENFGSGKFGDIVYVAGNPFVDKLLKGKFFKVLPVWRESWDSRNGTVMPGAIYEHTLHLRDILARDSSFISCSLTLPMSVTTSLAKGGKFVDHLMYTICGYTNTCLHWIEIISSKSTKKISLWQCHMWRNFWTFSQERR